jgi:hypothetical protein
MTTVADWAPLAAYIVGWLIACRVLARYAPDATSGGPVMLGLVALWWPIIAAFAVFALPVWLVTRGVRSRR